jgi:hypothetical protein
MHKRQSIIYLYAFLLYPQFFLLCKISLCIFNMHLVQTLASIMVALVAAHTL